ncbi:zinc finger HIT domain-containing protein 3 [Drosophila sulfurigaster albostrigata]|uniref:zinc finger HIT domain-containing protein 3 n=1 Tax=Drosophila sulfurigaster albostrigata TaxID=89887 RepID=UPI002D21B630|nr:zinc finger HIT domain-containing protein 3 [Drosophila sulfurigaster albostrigata]
MECVVESCPNLTNKYKCSKCIAPYCSVNCYKKHKESTQCEELAAAQREKSIRKPDNSQLSVEQEPTVYAPFSTEDTIPLALLQKLNDCEPLRQLLLNPHLRALLQQIDVAHNANLTMTAAMQEPLFIEFANACLQVVEPLTDAERAELQLST